MIRRSPDVTIKGYGPTVVLSGTQALVLPVHPLFPYGDFYDPIEQNDSFSRVSFDLVFSDLSMMDPFPSYPSDQPANLAVTVFTPSRETLLLLERDKLERKGTPLCGELCRYCPVHLTPQYVYKSVLRQKFWTEQFCSKTSFEIERREVRTIPLVLSVGKTCYHLGGDTWSIEAIDGRIPLWATMRRVLAPAVVVVECQLNASVSVTPAPIFSQH